jgi:hypothetical protein
MRSGRSKIVPLFGYRNARQFGPRPADDKLKWIEAATVASHSSSGFTEQQTRTEFVYDPRRNPVTRRGNERGNGKRKRETCRSFDFEYRGKRAGPSISNIVA